MKFLENTRDRTGQWKIKGLKGALDIVSNRFSGSHLLHDASAMCWLNW